MHWFLAVLRKYAVFSGRAQRAEYWYFILVYLIIALVLAFIENALGLGNADGSGGVLTAILGLALLLPSLAVGARRLHDIGRTGWWLLIGLIPLVGAIVLILFAVKDSQPGANAYGPNPKGVMA